MLLGNIAGHFGNEWPMCAKATDGAAELTIFHRLTAASIGAAYQGPSPVSFQTRAAVGFGIRWKTAQSLYVRRRGFRGFRIHLSSSPRIGKISILWGMFFFYGSRGSSLL